MTFDAANMIVRLEYPPMIKEIDAAFHVIGKPIIYAWGDTIYNPMKVPMYPQYFGHEAVHGMRQMEFNIEGSNLNSIENWWRRYIADPEFRLNEEIPAHMVEYAVFRDRHKDRNQRSGYMHKVARKLASPLYGSLITYKDAKALLEKLR
jgi:hypothetical protein